MRVFITLAVFIVSLASSITCRSADYDWDEKKWEFQIEVGLNTDGWQSGIGVGYYPAPCFGVKAAIGMAGELERPEDWGDDYYDTDRYASRFKFMPSIELRTPALGTWNSGYTTLRLFVNPGFILSPGASGSKNAKTACWDVKTGFMLSFGDGRVSLGYNISNFALYSGYPYSAYMQPDHDKYNTHSVFVGFSYSF